MSSTRPRWRHGDGNRGRRGAPPSPPFRANESRSLRRPGQANEVSAEPGPIPRIPSIEGGGRRPSQARRPVVMGPGSALALLACPGRHRISGFNFQTAAVIARSQRVRAKRGPMAGPATKQSRLVAASNVLDCCASLAMTRRARLRILAAGFARVMPDACPSNGDEGAGKAGCPMHPQPRVQ